MKTVFLTYGDINFASSRMRAYWIAEGLEDAIAIPWSEALKNNMQVIGDDTKNVIMQKMADPTIARQLRERGIQVIWDVCDPVWWFSPDVSYKIFHNVDKIVLSSYGLQKDFINLFYMGHSEHNDRSYVIEDRVKIQTKKRKRGPRKVVKMIWFGFSQNRISLYGALPTLERLYANNWKFILTIFDDNPDLKMFSASFPIHYEKWSLEKESEILSRHDIALLPPYPGEWGLVKSNNKKYNAWAHGLKVIDYFDYDNTRIIIDNIRGGHDDLYDSSNSQEIYIDRSISEWKEILK